jgi:hypothetical protein
VVLELGGEDERCGARLRQEAWCWSLAGLVLMLGRARVVLQVGGAGVWCWSLAGLVVLELELGWGGAGAGRG